MPTIRQYHESDRQAVVALWEAAGIARPWLDLSAEIDEKLHRDRELFLVAEDEGDSRRLVGVVMGAYDGRRGWVYHLAVEPARQREGIGGALMGALEAAFVELGVAKVNLQVRVDNAGVIGFYERLGYQDERRASMAKWLRTPPG